MFELPPALGLRLLGRPRISFAGEEITRHIKYRKGIALLGYLAANAGLWQSRDSLADFFWPKLGLSAAKTNLRQVLNNLCSVVNGFAGSEILQRDKKAVRLVFNSALHLDTALLSDSVLERIVADAPGSRHWRQSEVEPSIQDWGAKFLEGVEFVDMPEFGAWLEAVRNTFGKRVMLLLEHICRAQCDEGRLEAAVRTARLMVDFNPLEEHFSLMLMTLLAESGDGPGALEVFATLQQRLESELGLPPGERLTALRDNIAQGITTRFSLINLSEAAIYEQRWLVAMHCDFAQCQGEVDFDGALLEHVASVVQQRGGRVVSVVGRGVLSIFGLDEGGERSAERALIAARHILDGGAGASALRIGICAGQVLYKAAANMPHLLGEAPDLARCVSFSSAPGKVRVAESIVQQAGTSFRFAALGEQAFPGLDGLHKLFELTDARPQSVVSLPYPDLPATPFVGRRAELLGLQILWQEASAGRSRIAVLRAPAGFGKTRLVNEFAHDVLAAGGKLLRIACQLELAHQPLAVLLRGLHLEPSGAATAVPTTARGSGLQARFPGLDRESIEALEMLAGVETWQQPDALISKSAVFSALIRVIEQTIGAGPALLVVDDLHWADLATRELLGIFARGLKQQALLLVITSRPETVFDCPASLSQAIELAPLDEPESLSLIEACDNERGVTPDERRRIAQVAGGIPLFIEHLLRGWHEGEHHLLPLNELLQGELDRLGTARRVLRAAAVLGGSFRRQDLLDLLPENNVAAALSRAMAQGLVKALAAGTFCFQHDLIREAAYSSIQPARRQALHEQAARLLERQPGRPAEEIAHHYSAAGCCLEAAQWWGRAGASAMEREFAADAVVCFEKALAMLALLGEAADPVFVCAIQLQLGHAAQVCQGFGSPLGHRLFSEVARKVESAAWSVVDHHSSLFAALSGKYMGGSSQGEVEGLLIARRLERMAQSDTERLMACFALGNSLFWRGELLEAKYWQQEGIALAAQLSAGERIRYCVDDAAVTCRAFLAWNLWFLGDEAAACAMVREGVALARRGRRTHALCFALSMGVAMHWCRGALDEVVELASEALELARRYGFALWAGVNQLFLLWAQAKSGALADTGALFGAAAQMQQAYQAGITTSRWIAADALMVQCEWGEAESLIDLTIAEADFNEDLYCLPDLLWRKGECISRRASADQAAPYFVRASKLAQAQQAKGLLARFELQGSPICLPGTVDTL
jgi:DNA-binding SARP family transcriptional activator